MKRHDFIASSASATALAALYPEAILGAPNRIYTRLEITEFAKNAALVKALQDGVRAMRANTNPKDIESWDYWHNSHWMASGTPPPDMAPVWNQCLHHAPYFYAWHRGFVFFFEVIVRKLSKNDDFALPYWDYYKNPVMSPLFTATTLRDGSPNPLYWANRAKTTISVPGYAAYSNTLVNFPRTFPTAFEPVCEGNPHDFVHGQIGGSMGSVPTAAADPIFWMHHCNIDRLWEAWITAAGGRKMPPSSDPWWNKSWAWDLKRTYTMSVTQMPQTFKLGYTFADLTLPKPPPRTLPTAPPVLVRGAANASGPLSLGAASASVDIPISPALQPRLHATAQTGGPSIDVVLTGVQLTDVGANGGYSFNVYLNLPSKPIDETATSDETYYVGSINSFSISAMQTMQPGAVTLRFPASLALQAQARAGTLNARDLRVSFVRVGGSEKAPASATLVKIASVRIEAR